MRDITTPLTNLQGHVTAGDHELWIDRRGSGPEVLLLGGLSDTVESWTFQLDGLSDRYTLTAYDARGSGRSPMLPDGASVADMADDAAAVLRSLGIERAHVCGFSGGSVTAQELALRHPDLVASLVLVSTWARSEPYFDSLVRSLHWIVDAAPSDRAMLDAFFVWIYTARAHADGMVAAIIDEVVAFEHPQAPEGFHRQLEAWHAHDALDRLPTITAPTLVVAGDEDIITPARMSRAVADQILGAELVVLRGEAHQPFQEQAELFNALVDDFWSRIEMVGR